MDQEPSWHYCELCDAHATSTYSILEHFHGQKHKKKLAKREEMPAVSRAPSPAFFCQICNVSAHNMKVLMEHYGGSKHKANFAKAAKEDAVDAQETGSKPKKLKIKQVKLILDAVAFSDGKDLVNERRKLVIDLIENRHKNGLLVGNSSLSECGFCDRQFSTSRDCKLHRMSEHSLEFAAVKLLKENPKVITDSRILQ